MVKSGDESRRKILIAIVELSAKYEYSPTVRQIAEAVGLSHSPTHKHLMKLVADGLVLAPPRSGVGWRLTSKGSVKALALRQRSITNTS